jgi:hypothetical protein
MYGKVVPYLWLVEQLLYFQVLTILQCTICQFTCFQNQLCINWIRLGEHFSGKGEAQKKYHLVKWEIICKSKKKGWSRDQGFKTVEY